MIKATGANFVRLVHYPHDAHILELADEIAFWCRKSPDCFTYD